MIGHCIKAWWSAESMIGFQCFRCFAKMKHLFRHSPSQLDILVQKSFFSHQVQLFRQMSPTASLILCTVIVYQATNSVLGLPRWMTPQQDAIALLYNASSFLMWLFPHAFNVKTQNIIYMFFMTALIFFVSPVCSVNPMGRVTDTVMILLRISLGGLPSRQVVIWGSNVVFAISITLADISMSDEPRITTHVVNNVASLMMTLGFIETWRQTMKREMRNTLLLQHTKIDLSAAESLIDGMCDAVLELDGGLRLTKGESRFAALLLYDQTHQFVQQKLDTFMFSESDALYFTQNMSVPTAGASFTTDSFLAKLRDRDGNLVVVEAIHVSTKSISGDICHHVGLREQVDKLGDPSLSSVPDDSDDHGHPIQVWFDPSTFTINRCSAAFTSFCGSSRFHRDLMQWIPKANMMEFQIAYNKMLTTFSQGQAMNHDEDFGVLSLDVPIQMLRGETLLVMNAKCLFHLVRHDCTSDIQACLQFIDPVVIARQTRLDTRSRARSLPGPRKETGSPRHRSITVDCKAASSKSGGRTCSYQVARPSDNRSGNIHELHSSVATEMMQNTAAGKTATQDCRLKL